jgi:hypothetical protein
MLDRETLKTAPVPMLKYLGDNRFYVTNNPFGESATSYWLFQDCGESYTLHWWTNGWVIFYQESYLMKGLLFTYKNDIPSFVYSHYGSSQDWQHVFQTKEDAIHAFKKFWIKLSDGNSQEYVDEY